MSLKDIRIPADAADKQTTDARSALPPVEFTVSRTNTANVLAIQDRQGPQDRVSTVSYRVYFLPKEFSPSTGVAGTPSPAVYKTAIRAAGRKVANLVADIKSPALGTVLSVEDPVNFGSDGYYYCVGVNRVGVEAPPEHIVSSESAALEAGLVATTPTPPPPLAWVWVETTYGAALISGTIDGVNTAFTMTQAFGAYDVVFVDGIIDNAASAVGTALTVSTPPIGAVAVEHLA